MVEDQLGPDFYLWGSHFFVKKPREESIVPWHQDAQYWPLQPQNAVTVYIATPVAALFPTSLNFGNQKVGTTSSALTATLSNSGTAPLIVTGIGISGDFAQTDDCATVAG